MDRLMRKAQESKSTTTITRMRVYSEYNPGQYDPRRTEIIEDWGTACFAHLPAYLQDARELADDKFIRSRITDILYLPVIKPEFQTSEGMKTSLDYYEAVCKFMGVKESPASILIEGWQFDLQRSGQWNVAVGILLRHLDEYSQIPWTFCKLRKMGYGLAKSLFMAHFINYRDNDHWQKFNAPGGHTVLCARSSTWGQYKEWANWRARDTNASILETAYYRGINAMFGQTDGYNEAPAPISIAKFISDPLTEEHVREFGRKLRGKRRENPNRKPVGVQGGAQQEAQVDNGQERVAERGRAAVHGGVGRGPEHVHVEVAPPDLFDLKP